MLEQITKTFENNLDRGDSNMTVDEKIAAAIKEKLTKKHKVDDFVDDFKKSKAPQFKGKSADKKRKMAVAAYLAKQNEK